MRLQARLREEMAKPQAGWLQWFRRPVLAAALTVLMGVGIGLFFNHGRGRYNSGPNQAIAGQERFRRRFKSGKGQGHCLEEMAQEDEAYQLMPFRWTARLQKLHSSEVCSN